MGKINLKLLDYLSVQINLVTKHLEYLDENTEMYIKNLISRLFKEDE